MLNSKEVCHVLGDIVNFVLSMEFVEIELRPSRQLINIFTGFIAYFVVFSTHRQLIYPIYYFNVKYQSFYHLVPTDRYSEEPLKLKDYRNYKLLLKYFSQQICEHAELSSSNSDR